MRCCAVLQLFWIEAGTLWFDACSERAVTCGSQALRSFARILVVHLGDLRALQTAFCSVPMVFHESLRTSR